MVKLSIRWTVLFVMIFVIAQCIFKAGWAKDAEPVLGGYHSYTINIEEFGASPTASPATNDAAIAAAIAAVGNGGGVIVVPRWNYQISQPITIDKNALVMIGPHYGYATIENISNPLAVFVWAGASSESMLKIGTTGGVGVTGLLIKGISLDGGAKYGVSSITGIEIGCMTDGSAFVWSMLEDIGISRTFIGVKISRNSQVNRFKRIIIQNPTVSLKTSPVTGSIGIDYGTTGGGNTATYFENGAVQGFDTGMKIGGTYPAIPAGLWVRNMMFEGNKSYNIDVRAGDNIVLDGIYMEGFVDSTIGIKVGDNVLGTRPNNTVITNCRFGLGSSVLIRLQQFEGLTIANNAFLGATSGTATIIENTSGAPRNNGYYYGNHVYNNGAPAIAEFNGGTAGFNLVLFNNLDPATGQRNGYFDQISLGSGKLLRFRNVANTGDASDILSGPGEDLRLRTAGTERITILSNGNVGIGTVTPNSAAILDVSSTTKGFLPPRMTTTQRDAISAPSEGLTIYNTETKNLNFYDGLAWRVVTSN